MFHYELTIANVAIRSVTTKVLSGPPLPVTSMLSSTHTREYCNLMRSRVRVH